MEISKLLEETNIKISSIDNEKEELINLNKKNLDIIQRFKKSLTLIETIENNILNRISIQSNEIDNYKKKLEETIEIYRSICQSLI